MDKKIISFLIIILSVNSMFLVTGYLDDTSEAAQDYYSFLPSEYQTELGLGGTETTPSGGDSDIIKGVVSTIPFLSEIIEASSPIFELLKLAGKLSFGYFAIINLITAPGTALNLLLHIFLIPIGLVQVVAMAYLLLYVIAALAGWRP